MVSEYHRGIVGATDPGDRPCVGLHHGRSQSRLHTCLVSPCNHRSAVRGIVRDTHNLEEVT